MTKVPVSSGVLPIEDLEEKAHHIQKLALELGANEVSVSVSQGVSTEMGQRGSIIEKCQQSNSLGVGIELLVKDRFSSHSSCDLRPDALREFLTRAIQATEFLEPDQNRRLPDIEQMGDSDIDALDAYDRQWHTRTAEDRAQDLQHLMDLCEDKGSHQRTAPVRSITAWVWDGFTQSVTSTSNGFRSSWARTSFGRGAEITLEDSGGRLPEAYSYLSARHLEDVPDHNFVASDLITRGLRRVGSAATSSGSYPMLIDNRVVPRILSVLLGPISGTAIYEQRSCLAEKCGAQLAPSNFNLIDDPLLPRGLSSRPHDGDGKPSSLRKIVENGVLNQFFINIYNSRRMKLPATTGGSSNLIIPPGTLSPLELLKPLPKAIRVEGFLGGNTNAATGDFSFGVNGTLFEHGEPVQHLSEMNLSGNLFSLLQHFETASTDIWNFSSCRAPSLLFSAAEFSGT